MSLLPELAEGEARGEVAAIYAEMKRLGGVPMVALIFRHLATLPGALEWTWNAIGPAWKSGVLQETAWRIAGSAALTPIRPITPAELAATQMDGPALHEARIVLDAYNAANPENMLSVLCVLRLLEGAQATRPLEARDWIPPAAAGPLVAMTDPRALSPQLSAVLDLVAAPGPAGGPRVVQSLYRHFGHRPAFLELLVRRLRERFDDHSIDASVAWVRESMGSAADRLVQQLGAPPAPHPGIEVVCSRFGGAVIPQMIVVGRLLDEGLPA